MSRACQCCRTCLENSLGCRCCEASCCGKSKKKKGAVKEADWFLDLFSWTRAVGGDSVISEANVVMERDDPGFLAGGDDSAIFSGRTWVSSDPTEFLFLFQFEPYLTYVSLSAT